MGPFASLGPEQSGSRLAEQDSIANFMKMAQGQLAQAQAQQEQLKTQQARKEMEAIARLKTPDGIGGPGAGGSLADIPAYQGRQLYEMGLPGLGAKQLEAAAKIRFEEAGVEERRSQAFKQTVQAQGEAWTKVGQLAGSIRSEADWQAAGMTAAQAGLPNPFQGPFRPDKLSQIQSLALSRKDQLQLQLNASETRSENALRGARAGFLRERLRQHETEQIERKRHNEAVEKIAGSKDARGGKPITSPGTEELAAAERLVAAEIPGISEESLTEISDAVAAEAEALVAQIPGLNIDQARRRALQRWQEDGSIKVERGVLQSMTLGGAGEPSVDFEPGGRTPEEPITAKPGTGYIPGRYYRGPQGIGRRTPDGKWEMVGG